MMKQKYRQIFSFLLWRICVNQIIKKKKSRAGTFQNIEYDILIKTNQFRQSVFFFQKWNACMNELLKNKN